MIYYTIYFILVLLCCLELIYVHSSIFNVRSKRIYIKLNDKSYMYNSNSNILLFVISAF